MEGMICIVLYLICNVMLFIDCRLYNDYISNGKKIKMQYFPKWLSTLLQKFLEGAFLEFILNGTMYKGPTKFPYTSLLYKVFFFFNNTSILLALDVYINMIFIFGNC